MHEAIATPANTTKAVPAIDDGKHERISTAIAAPVGRILYRRMLAAATERWRHNEFISRARAFP